MNASIPARTLHAVLMVVLLLVVALTVFSPFYQTNDDVAMRLLAEGNFVPGDHPLPHLMFINIIIGGILSFAYSLTDAVPWYDLILGGSAVLASIGLVDIWFGSNRRSDIVWSLLFAIFFLLPIFVSVQFSLAGLTCTGAGVGLISRASVAVGNDRFRRRGMILGTALIVWGSLIRFEGAVLIAIEGAALALPFILAAGRNADLRPRLFQAMRFTIAAVLLTIVGFAANLFAYRKSPGWKDFYEYNFHRARIAEYATPERLTPEVMTELTNQVGWSANDFLLFRNWFFTDPDVFSLSKVRQAERILYSVPSTPTENERQIRTRRASQLAKDFFTETWLAFLVMTVFVMANGLRPKLVLYLLGIVVTLGCLVVGIGLFMKAPPQRVFWPMLIVAATMLTVAAQRWGRSVHWVVQIATVALAAIFMSKTVVPLKQESDKRRHSAEVAQQEVAAMRTTAARLYIFHSNSFPYEEFWRPLHPENRPPDFVGLGASARTPPVQNFLAKANYSDLPWSLCTEPGLVIITAPFIPPMLTTFVSEHRGATVQFDEVFKAQRLTAWKCHRM